MALRMTYDTTINATTTINAEPAEHADSVCSAGSASNVVSACHRARNVGDLLTGMAIVDTAIHPADPLADGGVLDLQEVGEIGRSHIEALVRRAQEESQLVIRQVRVLEGRRVAVVLLPVG